MNLSAMMMADAKLVLEEIGEPAVYNKITGQQRSILIVIKRQAHEANEQPRGVNQPVKIWALNDVIEGIASSEFLMSDTITYPKNFGSQETITKRIVRPDGESPGWTILELR